MADPCGDTTRASTVSADMGSPRVVLAPNAFKGTIDAARAVRAMQRGVLAAWPSATCALRPIADGGDGTVDVLVGQGYEARPLRARDSAGRWHDTFSAARGDHAVVELANTCGLALVSALPPQPLDASTLGLGDAITAALDSGARRISIAVGGSASTDGGAGMLVALGARLLDSAGRDVAPGGRGLGDIATVDLAGVDTRLAGCEVEVLADVTNPLHGPAGAAAVFAPQKGARPDQVALLDAGLRAWGDVLRSTTGRDVSEVPGAGAAGGTTAAALAVLGARVRPGSVVIAEAIGLETALAGADLVITGEGRMDAQTLQGKGCAHVLDLARRLAVPAGAVCGHIDLSEAERRRVGLAYFAEMGAPGAAPAGALETATRGVVARFRAAE